MTPKLCEALPAKLQILLPEPNCMIVICSTAPVTRLFFFVGGKRDLLSLIYEEPLKKVKPPGLRQMKVGSPAGGTTDVVLAEMTTRVFPHSNS